MGTKANSLEWDAKEIDWQPLCKRRVAGFYLKEQKFLAAILMKSIKSLDKFNFLTFLHP